MNIEKVIRDNYTFVDAEKILNTLKEFDFEHKLNRYLEEEYEDLSEELLEAESERDDFENELDEAKEEVRELETKVETLEKELEELKESSSIKT